MHTPGICSLDFTLRDLGENQKFLLQVYKMNPNYSETGEARLNSESIFTGDFQLILPRLLLRN